MIREFGKERERKRGKLKNISMNKHKYIFKLEFYQFLIIKESFLLRETRDLRLNDICERVTNLWL